MYTQHQFSTALADMREVLHNPFAALRLLRDIKNEERIPYYKFLGYTRYFFRFVSDKPLNDLFCLDPLVRRSVRLDRCIEQLKKEHKLGIVSDKQYRYLLMSLITINTTIKRYYLIYYFL